MHHTQALDRRGLGEGLYHIGASGSVHGAHSAAKLGMAMAIAGMLYQHDVSQTCIVYQVQAASPQAVALILKCCGFEKSRAIALRCCSHGTDTAYSGQRHDFAATLFSQSCHPCSSLERACVSIRCGFASRTLGVRPMNGLQRAHINTCEEHRTVAITFALDGAALEQKCGHETSQEALVTAGMLCSGDSSAACSASTISSNGGIAAVLIFTDFMIMPLTQLLPSSVPKFKIFALSYLYHQEPYPLHAA